MRIPREISGLELAGLLKKYGYQISRQTGSHMRLTTLQQGEHHITIPAHQYLKIGTLSGILGAVADHLQMDKTDLMKELF
ncbi:MAG: type II toxin-antitoxin system HicA family toxin [Candidatus Aminicenantes bacterium]|nr:type II toxin-antitoxin system HicA family toxin [Candidatus Aminicenantes bacterium]